MSYTYAQRKRAEDAAAQKDAAPAQPSIEALRSGAAQPTAEQMGHRVDLPDAMRAKMEESFGADLSAVKLYESQTVADAGAKAVTRGSDIAFAPGMLDFTSFSGQALLGHELSHVVSQARGEVTGGGYLNDYSLEARADREGAMAAAGQTVSMPTASLSPVSAAAAAGPMQAARDKDKENQMQADRITSSYDRLISFDPKWDDEGYDDAWNEFSTAVRGSSRGARNIISNNFKKTKQGNEYHHHSANPVRRRDKELEKQLPFAWQCTDGRLLREMNLQNAIKAARSGKAFNRMTELPRR